ncbi:hypothetical protein ES703_68353 [subsurface metagenome]
MFLIFIKLKLLRQVINSPINPNPDIACLAQVIKHRLILTLTVSNQRCQNHDTAILSKSFNSIHNLLHRLHSNLSSTFGAMGVTNPGKKQPQVIIDLGYSTHCRPWVFTRTLLVNRDGWAQPFYIINIGLFHPAQKLASISRQRFHIAALPLSIDGIKCQ